MTDVAGPPLRRFPGFPDRMELVPIPGALFGAVAEVLAYLIRIKQLVF